MSKLGLVIKREYLSRVKKKSFIVMTIVGPVLMAGLIIGAVWLMLSQGNEQNMLVVDDTEVVFQNMEKAGPDITFNYVPDLSLQQAKALVRNSEEYTSLVWFPKTVIEKKTQPVLFFDKQPGVALIRTLEGKFENIIEHALIKAGEIDADEYYGIKREVRLSSVKLQADGEESDVDGEAAMVGFGFSIAIYLFIFLYGVMVMRGVIEEKTSRIVEVIISSVKPFQLMMGKILGIAAVGLTQLGLWVILTGIFVTIASGFMAEGMMDDALLQTQLTEQMAQSGELMGEMQAQQEKLQNIMFRTNWFVMIGFFFLYFIGGYLLYASMFAAVGAAVDQEADSQQFMLPITIPLLFGFVAAEMSLLNPDSAILDVLSFIPFTSPVVMMVRVAMSEGGGIPIMWWEVITSLVLLYATFIGVTYLASRIYRTGILMYGKKVSWKELWKWLRYS